MLWRFRGLLNYSELSVYLHRYSLYAPTSVFGKIEKQTSKFRVMNAYRGWIRTFFSRILRLSSSAFTSPLYTIQLNTVPFKTSSVWVYRKYIVAVSDLIDRFLRAKLVELVGVNVGRRWPGGVRVGTDRSRGREIVVVTTGKYAGIFYANQLNKRKSIVR